jgi:hypothetical protein
MLIALLLLAANPEPRSVPEALTRLKAASGEALVAEVAAVETACRGKLRHELRDHAGLVVELDRRLAGNELADQKAILDLERCFTIGKMRPSLEKALGLEGLTPLAAEIIGRFEDPTLTPLLLGALDKRKATCTSLAADSKDADACVWLVYALGPTAKSADAASKAEVKKALEPLAAATHPKLKEVLANTLKSLK